MQQIAMGNEKADMVLKNGKVLNVFTNQIEVQDVAIADGHIVGVGKYSCEKEIDCTGKYVSPSFIDAHVHIESTMVLPSEFAKVVAKCGTTTVVADPHEIVNVKGKQGFDFLLESTKQLPIDVYAMVPSSVPATPFDTNGAGEFLADEMMEYATNPRVLGLGEVMCFYDAINYEKHIADKLELFKNKIADGHSMGIDEKMLDAYRLAGISNDHECTTYEDAYQRLKRGFNIFVREGSGAKNLEAILQGFLQNNIPFDKCCFCTDDKHLEDIMKEGHINFSVKKAVDLGVPVCEAVKMASYNTAKFYGLKNVGAVSCGYKANIAVLDENFVAELVLKDGKNVSDIDCGKPSDSIKDMTNTVQFEKVQESDLKLEASGKCHIIGVVEKQLLTKHILEEVPNQNGEFVANEDYQKIVVVERHGKNGNIGVGIVKGFGLKKGAIATTVSHDSHNLIAIGANDSDLAKAINSLKDIGGGFALANNGNVENLPLDVCGLMSQYDAETFVAKAKAIIEKTRELGVPKGVDPFINLSFFALPVIPEIRLLDTGLFDVEKFEKIDSIKA